jgi:hypothetical protein
VIIQDLFNKYIKDTKYKENVIISQAFVCNLNDNIAKIIGVNFRKVFISSKSLKHIYDRHIFDKDCPDDFYIILNNLKSFINRPDAIYYNKLGKRGDLIFVKKIKNSLYMCSIEINEEIEIVSAYITGPKYIEKFVLLWS